jgi:hypothetical protein
VTPSEIRQGLVAGLKSLPGLTVSPYRAANVQPPHAVIGLPQIEYDSTFGRGSDTLTLQILVYVSRADDELAQANLDEFLSGHGDRSLKTVLEDTSITGLTEAMVRVVRTETGTASSADGSEWMAATFDVQVIVSGLS